MNNSREQYLKEQIERDRAAVAAWPPGLRERYTVELSRALKQPTEDRRGELY